MRRLNLVLTSGIHSVLTNFLSRKAIVDLQANNQNVNIILTGHSLGGSQAALASNALNLVAITFNASGVNPTNYRVTPTNKQITNYSVYGEIMTTAELMTPIPKALGRQIVLIPDSLPMPISDNVFNHASKSVLSAMKAPLPVPVR